MPVAFAAALWPGNSTAPFLVRGSICIMGVLLPFFTAALAVLLP